jgi:hypothetical protein
MLADCVSMRTRTWRCVLVLLVAVAGIVAGILAMHVVSTPVSQPHEFAAMEAAAPSAGAPSAQSHPGATASTMPESGMGSGCGAGGCDPMHDMTAMVCTLALLAGTILLIAPALGRALLTIRSHAAPADLARIVARSVGSPSPPSLLALSVDRR